MTLRNLLPIALAGAVLSACSSKPAAEVSKKDLAEIREAHSESKLGQPKQKVLDSFKPGNAVKLGSSAFGGATIEEWKVEAYHDESKRKNLFVTFLYFCNDKFVDSSDTRIDFRNNTELVDRWKQSVK